MLLRKITIISLALALAAISAMAQKKVDPSELSYGDNLTTPAITAKAMQPIKSHLKKVKDWFDRHDYTTEFTRDDEVLVVTIPCADLFPANETELKKQGKERLAPFVTYLQHPTMYKIVVAVHSDNTGEAEYCDDLTSDRANAIDEFLFAQAKKDDINLIPYGLGRDEPLNDNNSVSNRGKNRRVEFYIIPEWQMIENAKAGKLN